MIGGHPGGIRLTRRLLELAGASGKEVAKTDQKAPSGRKPVEIDSKASAGKSYGTAGAGIREKALDLGAGSGETVRYLRTLGYDAAGIDQEAEGTIYTGGQGSEAVISGDMTALPFPDGCYDLCLAECSVAVCGDGPAALREAYRVLCPGGSLLLSDVFFIKENAPCLSMPKPLTLSCWEQEFHRAGYDVLAILDETSLWKEFFLESLWNDNADGAFCDFFKEAGRAGCGYFLAWLKKPEQSKGEENGFI